MGARQPKQVCLSAFASGLEIKACIGSVKTLKGDLSFMFWKGWKASIVLALFLGSTSSTLESWIKRTLTDQSTVIFKTYCRREDSQPESQKVKRKDVCHGPCFYNWWLRLFIVKSSLVCLIQVFICILFIYQLAPTPLLWPGLAGFSNGLQSKSKLKKSLLRHFL